MTRIRNIWHRHGSWALLTLVGLMCFGAGVQMQTHTMAEVCRYQAEKIERLTVENALLANKLIPAAEKAAENIERAVERLPE